MYTVQSLDPYDDMGEKWEKFKNKSAAEVYGRSHFGIDNFIVVPSGEVNENDICRQTA